MFRNRIFRRYEAEVGGFFKVYRRAGNYFVITLARKSKAGEWFLYSPKGKDCVIYLEFHGDLGWTFTIPQQSLAILSSADAQSKCVIEFMQYLAYNESKLMEIDDVEALLTSFGFINYKDFAEEYEITDKFRYQRADLLGDTIESVPPPPVHNKGLLRRHRQSQRP